MAELSRDTQAKINMVRGSFMVDGLTLSDGAEDRLVRCAAGKITIDEAIMELDAKHRNDNLVVGSG